MEETKSLVRKSQKGDIAAFEELVRRYQNKVYTLSFNLTGNAADAQDLAQEVFLRAFTSLAGFRNEADFGTWLHRLTVNLWLNARQRQKGQVVSLDAPLQTEEGEVAREVAAAGADPGEALESRELQELVRQALARLPGEQKVVLILREIEGYSYEEIAGILGCAVGTVKSRLNRARQGLKEIMHAFLEGKK